MYIRDCSQFKSHHSTFFLLTSPFTLQCTLLSANILEWYITFSNFKIYLLLFLKFNSISYLQLFLNKTFCHTALILAITVVIISIPLSNSAYVPNCSCSYTPKSPAWTLTGCRITLSAPSGYACRCDFTSIRVVL